MSIPDDHKLVIGAGVAGIVGAGLLGYFIGRKCCNQSNFSANFVTKSSYRENKGNPIADYIVKNSLREAEVLRKIKEETLILNKMPQMLGAPEEAQLFRLLLKQINAKKIIEVGVYTGYNTVGFAMSIPDDGKVVGCDITDEYINAVGKRFFKEVGVENKIDLRIKSAVDSLDELIANGESGTYDFAFIDADKVNYDIYYEKCLVLARKGGIIAIDNTLYSGEVVKDPSEMSSNALAIHNFNLKVHKDSRVDMVLLPFADGVTLAAKL